MWSTSKSKLSCHDQSDYVQSVTKTRQDHNMTDRISLVYTENDIELLGPIRLGVVCDETTEENDVIDLSQVGYINDKTQLS